MSSSEGVNARYSSFPVLLHGVLRDEPNPVKLGNWLSWTPWKRGQEHSKSQRLGKNIENNVSWTQEDCWAYEPSVVVAAGIRSVHDLVSHHSNIERQGAPEAPPLAEILLEIDDPGKVAVAWAGMMAVMMENNKKTLSVLCKSNPPGHTKLDSVVRKMTSLWDHSFLGLETFHPCEKFSKTQEEINNSKVSGSPWHWPDAQGSSFHFFI